MELSEIKQIAELAAQETLIRIGRYTKEYFEPESVAIGLSQSMSEENTASDWYAKRAVHAKSKGDPETARIYEHVAKEEETHSKEFEKRLFEVKKKSGIGELTPRETEVLKLMSKGASNKDIAHSLNISEQTVKNHTQSIYQKLEVDSRTKAVILGLTEGLLNVEGTPAKRNIPLSDEEKAKFKEFLQETLGEPVSDEGIENIKRCFKECIKEEPATRSKINWEKVPSVTTGCKDFFYTAVTPLGRRWVVWDRLTKTWHVTAERIGGQETLKEFKTPEEGMSFIEESPAMVRILSGAQQGSIISKQSWDRELAGMKDRGETPPDYEIIEALPKALAVR